ncbi:hypothetical protein PINS_up012245 [Pythium insidiosum]|nr:hypothetical protein PINS_up012245 [Pythium insidiosum]
MLPLSLLKTAQGQPMLVELKNGDTYNGNLVNCDTWMNINLREVICTSKDGDRFWKMPECYIRGNAIKYIRVPNEILDQIAKRIVVVVVEDGLESVREVDEVDADLLMARVAEEATPGVEDTLERQVEAAVVAEGDAVAAASLPVAPQAVVASSRTSSDTSLQMGRSLTVETMVNEKKHLTVRVSQSSAKVGVH